MRQHNCVHKLTAKSQPLTSPKPVRHHACVLLSCCVCGQSDYEAANFDVKKAKGYWQLGRLGQGETQELQAKVGRSGWLGRGCGEVGARSAISWVSVKLDR